MPAEGRFSSHTSPFEFCASKSHSTSLLRFTLRVLTGNFSGSPWAKAWHSGFTGQAWQLGLRGKQMVAPKSISACEYRGMAVLSWRVGNAFSAICHKAFSF
jgi:hypothetical protein